MNAKPRKDESDERDEPLASEDEVEHEVSVSKIGDGLYVDVLRMTAPMWSCGRQNFLSGRGRRLQGRRKKGGGW
jgi:hypothetical protein